MLQPEQNNNSNCSYTPDQIREILGMLDVDSETTLWEKEDLLRVLLEASGFRLEDLGFIDPSELSLN